MSVFLDVKTRLDVRLAEAAAREATDLFRKAGDDINKGLSGSISRALGSFDGSAARREIASLQNSLSGLGRAEEEAARVMQRSYSNVEIAQRKLLDLNKGVQEAQQRILDITGGVADAATASSAKMARAERDLAAAHADVAEGSAKRVRAERDLADAQAVAARSSRDHVDAMVAAEAGHQKLAKATDDSAAATTRAGQVWNGVGVASLTAFGAALFETTKKAGDYQQATVKIGASTEQTAAQLKTVSDGVLQMAGSLGYGPQSLMSAMYDVEKAGYRDADALMVLQSAGQGAKAENADLTNVLNGLTTSMHDFGFSASQSADVMSKMVIGSGMAKASFQDFAGSLHNVEPIVAGVAAQLDSVQAKQHLMADTYGSLAELTQAGMGTDQATQNMAHIWTNLIKPSQGMRDELGALGLDVTDLQEHLGERGLAKTLQIVQQAIQANTKDGKVNLDVMYQNGQTARAEAEAFNALPGPAKAVAQAIKDNTLSYKEFRKSRGGLSVEMANDVQQWVQLENKVTGFSNTVKSGVGTLQTYDQAMALATGGQDSLRTALQLTGENADQTNQGIDKIDKATRAANGTVVGFNETADTLNFKMDQAKGAFSAAAIEMGDVFVPIMTDVANVAKTVGDAMAKHPQIAHDVIDALGLLGGAWLSIKALNIAETILTPIVSGLAGMAAGEEAAAASAATLKAGLTGIAAVGVPAAAAAVVGQQVAGPADDWVAQHIPGGQWIENHNPSELGLAARQWFDRTFATGGAVTGPGPKGKDSVPTWMAPGEHVLTAGDVDAMGGQTGVYAFRNALHRAGGGPPVDDGSWGPGDTDLTAGIPTDPGDYVVSPDRIQSALGYAAQNSGRGYQYGTLWDCSGFMSQLYGIVTGKAAPVGQRFFSTESDFTKLGFLPGYDPSSPFNIGVHNGGGGMNSHMAGTLGGYNVESGGSGNRVQLGGSAAGALNPEFEHHYHLPGSMSGMDSAGGYYAPDPAKVARLEGEIKRKDDAIRVAEEKVGELKSNAKQSERDRLQYEIDNDKADLKRLNDELAAAKQGTYHAGRSGRGSSRSGSGGGLQFGAPLPANFGLNKGLPGFFEWLATFAADMAIGPIEGAMLGNAIRSGQMGDMGDGSGAPGGFADLGNQGSPISLDAGSFPIPSGGSGGGSAGAATPSGDSGSSGIPGLNLATTGKSGLYSPANTNPALNNPAAAGIPGMNLATAGGSARPGAAPYVPGPQVYGPPLPFSGYSADTLSRLHGDNEDWHVPDPSGQQTYDPLPSVDQLRKQFSGSVPLFPQAPPSSNYAKDWYQFPQLQVGQHFSTGGTVGASAGSALWPANGVVETDTGNVLRKGYDPSWGWGKKDYDKGASRPHPSPDSKMPWVPQDGSGVLAWSDTYAFANGGPSGTDTIPAWLSPGEFVMNANATKNHLQALQFMNAGHFDVGSLNPLTPPKPPPNPGPPQPPQGKQQPKLGDKPQGQPHIPVGGPSSPGPGNLSIPGGSDTQKGLATPGSSTQQFGEGLPPSGGIGFGGGLIGAAEGAASQAGGMGMPGGAAGIQAAFQALNRTAGYIGQLGGIAAEGILSTFLPADSALSNFSNTLPGKLIAGIAGVRPGTPNSAGKTAAPLKPKEGEGKHGGGDTHNGNVFNAPITVKADDPNKFNDHMQRQYSAAQAAYPMNTP